MVKYTTNTNLMAMFTSSGVMLLCSSCRTDRLRAQEKEEEEEEQECTRARVCSVDFAHRTHAHL